MWYVFLVKHFLLAVFLILIWWLTRPVYLDFRRRHNGYGVVFDVYTGEPQATVVIRLKNLMGRIVRTVVTDREGRYRLMAPKGEYYVQVDKPGYFFPSQVLARQKQSRFYNNLLSGDHIFVQDYGVITKNIAIEPEASKRKPLFLRGIHLGKNTQYWILLIGSLLGLFFVLIQITSWMAWSLYLVYAAVMIGRLMSFKPAQPPFGTIRDSFTKHPLPQVIVRIMDKQYNKLLETQITSAKGRYAFIVKRGAYRVMIEKKGYRKVILNFPQINQDGFLLAKDVSMTKIDPRA